VQRAKKTNGEETMNTYPLSLARFSVGLMLCALFVFPASAQLISIFPRVDSLNFVGSCTPPRMISQKVEHSLDRDTIMIRSVSGDPLCTGFPPNQANTIPAFYFIVRSSMNQYHYELWLRPCEYGSAGRLDFDTMYSPSPQLYLLVLKVFSGDALVDSARMRFRSITTGLSVDDANISRPYVITLKQNYPNPFNPSTTIRYELPRAAHVTLTVYDVLGRQLATLVNGTEEPGYKSVEFNGSNLASGLYFYRLTAGSFVQTKNLLLLR
jgi:hypothetical protein